MNKYEGIVTFHARTSQRLWNYLRFVYPAQARQWAEIARNPDSFNSEATLGHIHQCCRYLAKQVNSWQAVQQVSGRTDWQFATHAVAIERKWLPPSKHAKASATEKFRYKFKLVG